MSASFPVRAPSRCGAHLWGSYTVRPVGRTLWSSRTLTLHPPGTTSRERALLRAWHGWPVAGSIAVLLLLALTSSSPLGLFLGVGAYVAGFVVLGRLTRRVRPRVRTVTVTVFHGGERPETHGDARFLSEALDTLCLLERALCAGHVLPVDFESVWADVYELVPRARTASAR